MAYRLHKTESANQEDEVKENEVKETAESLRARFIAAGEEIRANEVTIEARKSEIAQLEKEREELRKKVRAMGFDFFEASAEPAADMTDPKNWQVGDLVEVVSLKSRHGDMDYVEVGKCYPIAHIAPSNRLAGAMHLRVMVDGKENWFTNGISGENYKFHSRPSN